jgi:hypothetical protein
VQDHLHRASSRASPQAEGTRADAL